MLQPPTPYTPFAQRIETLRITPDLAARAGLVDWAAAFALGTAGYRDLLDPRDLFNLEVPFNAVTVAVMLAARQQLAREAGLESLHVGGEVRPHTEEFIDLAARIYAAGGLRVHLRPAGQRTTPIWFSSFGVFYEELDGGENFTASHSQSFKGGWKPMDAAGGQLLPEAGRRIAERVRELAGQAVSGGLEIPLAAASNPLIRRDFDPLAAYVTALRQVIPAGLLAEIPRAAAGGFRAAICTEGGSMAGTARRIFEALDVQVGEDRTILFTHQDERSDYYGIGILDGVNHGVDPGKWQVYKHVGAQAILREKRADIFFIWDPDGDRFNMITTAPAALAGPAQAAGLEVDPLDAERCLVFFKPNQIYFLLTAARLAALHEAGELDRHDWLVTATWPTSRSLGELARSFAARSGARLGFFQVPVGFKHFAQLVGDLEEQLAGGAEVTAATDATGTRTEFGPRPRLLIMAEESGGAAFGPAEPVISHRRRRTSLASKEKDGFQVGVMALALAARLHRTGSSFAAHYLELLEEHAIVHRFYERRDVTLFDESLQGEARERARAEGNRRKQAAVDFFAGLEKREPAEVEGALRDRLPGTVQLPPVQRVFHAGDGTLIEMEGQWFELRASGTDAVLRYYMEGRDAEQVARLNEAFTKLETPAAGS